MENDDKVGQNAVGEGQETYAIQLPLSTLPRIIPYTYVHP